MMEESSTALAAPPSDPESAPIAFEPTSKGRLDSVQVLRAVAATAVVFVHLPLFHHGGWGLDLFFVISGFIMCYVTERSTKDFFAKRIIRIAPLYWLGTLAVFAIAVVAPQFLTNTTTSATELLKSLFFVPFKKGSGVYEPVLFLGWTLNLEMAFYALFALCARISHRYRATICSLVIIVVAALRHFLHPTDGLFFFYSQPLTLDFAWGMASYYVIQAIRRRPNYQRNMPTRATIAVSGALLLACVAIANHPKHDLGAVLFGLCTAAAFTLIVTGFGYARFPRFLTIVGDASYSLYLFHPYIVGTFRKVLHTFKKPNIVGYATSLLSIGISILIAVALFTCIEKPLTKALRKRFL